ncbi:MAG: 3-deoxy-D-manno-octulosonic acid transferase [Rhodospirillales bacterium]|nr:3-deoxy-D-manno-octulosonic acid transferase [Rhodospirillales bacterium]
MILSLYRCFGTIGAPLISLYLNKRKRLGKEDPARFDERLGIAGCPRPAGPLVWLHAASVGESLSLLPLIARLQQDRSDVTCLLTTGTVTSARLMAERLPAGVIHQFVPVDRMVYVRRFFDHWQPDLVLWAESDFWPNLVAEPARRGIPLVLINGRISPKSFRGWCRYPGLIKVLLSGFSLCLGQTDTDADRLKQLGAPVVRCVGNLKFAVKPLPANDGELQNLAAALQGRQSWFAASTHAGEEALLWQTHQNLAAAHPTLLTIIAPRHPTRGPEVAEQLRALGAQVSVRSKAEPITRKTQVYLADTLGEMGLFFRLCALVFMGKSFVDKGGQNPLEAAQLGCTILHGPHMWNFAEMIGRMEILGAARQVADSDALADALSGFFRAPDQAREMAEKAAAFARSEAGVLDAIAAEIKPYLDKLIGEKECP